MPFEDNQNYIVARTIEQRGMTLCGAVSETVMITR